MALDNVIPTMNQQTCYMCSQVATSKEHVPPRCLFPEAKDIQLDLRKELITVPSCDLHNTDKSQEDQFLLASLAGIVGTNSIGLIHKLTKVNRAIKRSKGRIFNESMNVKEIDWVEIEPNKYIDVVWGTPDFDRLYNCFDHIIRGLYFHHFGYKFDGQTKVHLGYLRSPDHEYNETTRWLRNVVKRELAGKEWLGSNPEVFRYQFTDPNQYGVFTAHLQFYGGIDVYIGLIPEGDPPPQELAWQLINMGITVHTQVDGEPYVFNKQPDSPENERMQLALKELTRRKKLASLPPLKPMVIKSNTSKKAKKRK